MKLIEQIKWWSNFNINHYTRILQAKININ